MELHCWLEWSFGWRHPVNKQGNLQIKLPSPLRTHWYYGEGEGSDEGWVMRRWKLRRMGQLVIIVGSEVIWIVVVIWLLLWPLSQVNYECVSGFCTTGNAPYNVQICTFCHISTALSIRDCTRAPVQSAVSKTEITTLPVLSNVTQALRAVSKTETNSC